ncbi:MAG: aminotransferase class III-fold pyridoxal phosphate-dependent enzyme [Planctomycetota bacterium]
MPPDNLSRRSDLQRRDHAAVWHPCAQMHDYEAFPPLPVRSASGCVLELEDGRLLLDTLSSWWCKSLGHGHPRLTAALREQSEKFEHVMGANTTSELLVSMCERLLHAANTNTFAHRGPRSATAGPSDPHFTKCFFADNGSTGVEVALKMALQAQHQSGRPQRTKLAALKNGYHGETAAAMSVSDLDLYTSPHASLMTEVIKLGPVPFRSGVDDPDWMDASAEWPTIERTLERAKGELAAIIYEPVLQAAGDMRPYSPDLLRRLRAWADARDVFLIADEIAAGLGRCGAVLASQLACANRCEACGGASPSCAGPLPDFAVVSKGLTAGYVPMSVVLTTQAVYERFYGPYASGIGFMHSNTYAGNALAAAVAHAAMDEYAEIDVLARVAKMGPVLREKLWALADGRPYLRHPRGLGMTAAIEICGDDGEPLDLGERTGYAVFRAATESTAGVLPDGRRCGAMLRALDDTIYLFPPLNVEEPEIDAMVAVAGDALDRVMSD